MEKLSDSYRISEYCRRRIYQVKGYRKYLLAYLKRSRAPDKLARQGRRERLQQAPGAFAQPDFGGDDYPTAESRKWNPPLTEAGDIWRLLYIYPRFPNYNTYF